VMDADPPEIRGRPVWDGGATDRRTRSGPSGYWARHVRKVSRVIGGGPCWARVAASTVLSGAGLHGSRTGSYDRGGRVTPVEERALTSGVLLTEMRIGDWR